MSTLTGSGRRARARKPFWQTNAFWFVGMPTTLVGFVFMLGMVAEALGR